MGVTVNANMMSIVHQGSTGVSPSFPDVCKTPTPGGPIPIPYPNIAMSSDTDKGSKTVKIDKKKVMLKESEFKMSSGDEAGSAQGVASNKIKGKASFVNYSFDVKIDGKNVVRLLDPAQTNQGSPANTVSPAIGQAPVVAKGKEIEGCNKTKKKEKTQKQKKTSWGQCGILESHQPKIQQVATREQVVLYFRQSNNECKPWIALGHMPKPHDALKANTIKLSNMGNCQKWLNGETGDPQYDKWVAEKEGVKGIKTLNSEKFFSWSAKEFLGVVMANTESSDNGKPLEGYGNDFSGDKSYKGKWMTGDYDLMDIHFVGDQCQRPLDGGTAFKRVQNAANSAMGWDGIQHPPQSTYVKPADETPAFDLTVEIKGYLNSNKKTPPSKALTDKRSMPVMDSNLTVVAPDGRVVTLDTDEDVKNAMLCAGCANPGKQKR